MQSLRIIIKSATFEVHIDFIIPWLLNQKVIFLDQHKLLDPRKSHFKLNYRIVDPWDCPVKPLDLLALGSEGHELREGNCLID
jgi:hypothetical protein